MTARSCAAAVALLAALSLPAQALDLSSGGELRGAVGAESADWQRLAALEMTDEAMESALDEMVREDRGEPAEAPPERSSMRAPTLDEIDGIVPEGNLVIEPLDDGADEVDAGVTVSAVSSMPARPLGTEAQTGNLMGPARAPAFVPLLPDPSPSVAVLPRDTWGTGSKRSSVSVLGAF